MAKHIITENCERVLQYPFQPLKLVNENEVWVNEIPPNSYMSTGKIPRASSRDQYITGFIGEELIICDVDLPDEAGFEIFARRGGVLRAPLKIAGGPPSDITIRRYALWLWTDYSFWAIIAGNLVDCRCKAPTTGIVIVGDEGHSSGEWATGRLQCSDVEQFIGLPCDPFFRPGPYENCLPLADEHYGRGWAYWDAVTWIFPPPELGLPIEEIEYKFTNVRTINCAYSPELTRCYHNIRANTPGMFCHRPGWIAAGVSCGMYIGTAITPIGADWRDSVDEDGYMNGYKVIHPEYNETAN